MAPAVAIARDSIEGEDSQEALLAPFEPQMLELLADELQQEQQKRRKPNLPTRREWLLQNAQSRTLSAISRLQSFRALCPNRLPELNLDSLL